MEKMKIDVGTMAALALVAVVVTTLGISFGIVQAAEEVEAEVEAKLKLQQTGSSVYVEVEAKGLLPDEDFTMRPYKSGIDNCMRGGGNAHGSVDGTSDEDGELTISVTIDDIDVDDVGSVSIRSTGSPGSNPPVVCFQDTTP